MRIRFTLAAVALLLVVAGCTGPKRGGTEPTATVPPIPATFTFSPNLVVPASTGFAEPGIKVAADGTIYLTAPGARGGPPVVGGLADTMWRSDDGGATFNVLPTPDPGSGGGDSDIAVSPDGTVYHSGLSLGCVSLSVSRDKGQTWQTNPLACGYALVADDRNWIATKGNQYVYLTFGWAPDATGEASDGRMTLIRTLVSGQTAAATTTTVEDNYQWPGFLAVDQTTGTVYVSYNTVDDELVIQRSTDDGLTLTKKVAAKDRGDTFDSFSVVAVDKAGTVYLAWSERDAKDGQPVDHTDVFYTFSKDHADTWAAPIKVNSAKGSHIFPWIDAASPGHLVVAWYGTNATGKSAEEVDGLWDVYVAETHNGDTANPTFEEHIASDQPIAKGSICTSGTGCKAGTRALLDYFQVAFDPKEHAHAVWASKANGDSKEFDNPTTLVYAKQLIGTSASAAP